MSREILALDVASRTGIAEGVPGAAPRLYHQQFLKEHESGKGFEHLETMAGRALVWMAERLQISLPARIVIEAPPPEQALQGQTNARSTAVKIMLVGALAGVAAARGVPVRFRGIGQVRKHFIGRGNLPGDVAKPRVKRVCELLGWEPANYDQSDAAALWAFECAQLFPNEAVKPEPLFVASRDSA